MECGKVTCYCWSEWRWSYASLWSVWHSNYASLSYKLGCLLCLAPLMELKRWQINCLCSWFLQLVRWTPLLELKQITGKDGVDAGIGETSTRSRSIRLGLFAPSRITRLWGMTFYLLFFYILNMFIRSKDGTQTSFSDPIFLYGSSDLNSSWKIANWEETNWNLPTFVC